MVDRSLRQRGAVLSYCEYDDDDFESPVKKAMKKRVIDSDSEGEKENRAGTILAFTKKGIDNAAARNLQDQAPPKRDTKRNQTARSRKTKMVTIIDDSDIEEEDIINDEDPIQVDEDSEIEAKKPSRRPLRSKSRSYKEQSSSDEEEEEADDDDEEEEEALFDSSSEDEDEDIDVVSDDSQSDDDGDGEEENDTSNKTSKRRMTTTRQASATATVTLKKNSNNTRAKKPSTTTTTTSTRATGVRRTARATARPRFSYAIDREEFDDYEDDEVESENDDDSGDDNDNDDDDDDDDVMEYQYTDAADNVDGEWNINDDDAVLVNIEKILSSRKESDGSHSFRVKLKGKSYRQTRWLPRDVLWASAQRGVQSLVRNFEKKARHGELDPYGDLDDGVHADWMVIDRIVTHSGFSLAGGNTTTTNDSGDDSDVEIVDDDQPQQQRRRFLVKWRGLNYSESTWETDATLTHDDDNDAIQRYIDYTTDAIARKHNKSSKQQDKEQHGIDIAAMPEFCNNRSLRDYQKESLRWMATHWYNGQNCILGDEMGLGKTAQSISVLAFQQQYGNTDGPFLVIAPLTTLGHWQREIQTWTTMNCIVYAGSAADREMIQKYELWVNDNDGDNSGGRGRSERVVKPHVVLSSYEVVLRDQTLFQGITWETIIIDEAHRMKATSSSTRTAIAAIPTYWLLLLTGTPVQNNMRELYGLLNLLDPGTYPSEQSFLDTYGDDRTGVTPEQVKALQAALRPILLRRMKEDVETLPEKEECIIWVQLTADQRAYYKAIFEGQIGTLLAGSSTKNLPNLRNLAMELRKVCCHPFLCDGLEDDAVQRRQAAGVDVDQLSALVHSSGKMLLLHKLLPKLRAEGHKVLIFSQFKIMLDVLEDYLSLAGHPFERIDGSTSGRDRQAAIDRFSKEGSDGFVFLLSTRAGGQGITLTAADTCIIYDSDWNPQNDLQAMARCHRIGQEKEVTIYRLVSKDTYEENIFKISSKKYGLDEAILGCNAGNSNGSGGNPENDGKKIAELLKHGAHCLAAMDTMQKETDAFASEDIDEILKGRTEKRQIGGRAGNTFSMATFNAEEESAERASSMTLNGSGSGDGAAFWSALLPEAVAAHEEKMKAASMPVILPPRQRKRINYSEQFKLGRRGSGDDYTGGDDDDEDGSDGEGSKRKKAPLGEQASKKKKKSDATAKEATVRPWARTDVEAFLERILRVGFKRSAQAAEELKLVEKKRYSSEDITAVASVLEAMLNKAVKIAPEPVKRRRYVPEKVPLVKGYREVLIDKHKYDGEIGGCAVLTTVGNNEYVAIDRSTPQLREREIQEENERKMAQYERDIAAKVPELNTIASNSAPSAALRVLTDGKVADRLLRNCHKYKAHLDHVAVLNDIVEKRGLHVPLLSSRGLPMWFSKEDVVALCTGCHTLGYECTSVTKKSLADIEMVLMDERFGFTKKVGIRMEDGVVEDKGEVKVQEGVDNNNDDDNNGVNRSEAAVATTTTNTTVAAANPPQQHPSTTITTTTTTTTANGPAHVMTPEQWNKFKEVLLKLLKTTLKYIFDLKSRLWHSSLNTTTAVNNNSTTAATAAVVNKATTTHTILNSVGATTNTTTTNTTSASTPSSTTNTTTTNTTNINNNNNSGKVGTQLLKKAVHNNAKSLGQLLAKPSTTTTTATTSTMNGNTNATIDLQKQHSVNSPAINMVKNTATHDNDDDIVIDDDPIETSDDDVDIVTVSPVANNNNKNKAIAVTSTNNSDTKMTKGGDTVITPAVHKTTTTQNATITTTTTTSPSGGDDDDTATPLDGRMNTEASINVFDETRGGFTDPLTVSAERKNKDTDAVLKRKKENIDDRDGAAKVMKLSPVDTNVVVGGMRQRSLFELKKVKVLKRTVNGIEPEEEAECRVE